MDQQQRRFLTLTYMSEGFACFSLTDKMGNKIPSTMFFAAYDDQDRFPNWSAALARESVMRMFDSFGRLHLRVYESASSMREDRARAALYVECDSIYFAISGSCIGNNRAMECSYMTHIIYSAQMIE